MASLTKLTAQRPEALQAEQKTQEPRAAIPFFIPTEQIEQYWPVMNSILQKGLAWTQLITADYIRPQLEDGTMLAWGVIDDANQLVLSLIRLTESAQGTLCSALLVVPTSDDDAGLCALLCEMEGFARRCKANFLQISTAPWMAQKVQDNMRKIRQSAVVMEMDLRAQPKLNS